LPAAYEGLGPPSIRAMDCLPGSQIFVVGTGQCDVWEVDAEPNILVAGHVADLVAVDAHPTRPNLFATAAASDRVFVWDADARRLRATARIKRAIIRCVSWAPPDGKLLAVGAMDGRVVLLDGRGGALAPACQAETSFNAQHGACAEPTVLRFTSDGRRLAVGTRGATIELFAVIEEGLAYALLRLGVCVGHSSTVRQLDWSVDDTVLQSSCQAYELLYWDGLRAEQLRSDQRDRAWQTWSCTVGWPVMGIWPDGYDNTDINALDRSDGGSAAAAGVLAGGYVAVADDFGHVLLFNHPCVRDDAPHLRSRGHSSHVTGVRFLRGSQRCVSIGGHDRAVFQWALWRRDDPDSDT
jgi:microtubule-associated protein-like 6